MVEELCSYTPQDLADLDALMHELSATSFCNEELLSNANVIRRLRAEVLWKKVDVRVLMYE